MRGELCTVAAVCAMLVAGGCEESSDDGYFPLAEGMRWIYTVQVVVPGRGVLTSEAIVEVTGTEELHGQSYYKVERSISVGSQEVSETNYYRTGAKGIYWIRGSNVEARELLVAPLPFEPGREWTVQGAGVDLAYGVDTAETIELPNFTFASPLEMSFSGTIDGTPTEGRIYLAHRVGRIGEVSEIVVDGSVSLNATMWLQAFSR